VPTVIESATPTILIIRIRRPYLRRLTYEDRWIRMSDPMWCDAADPTPHPFGLTTDPAYSADVVSRRLY
jgi:hypothetical protein